MRRVLIVILVCLLPMGCSLQQMKNNQLSEQLRSQPPEKILTQLQSTEPDDTDIAQYYLNVGYLKLVTGKFHDATESFLIAKKQMHTLQATSVTENIAAGTINETFRQYSGTATDQVMLHNMLALSYLFDGDIYGARVEMLQADVTMKRLATSSGLYGQLASANLLSGIIYELLDERSNAFISYRLSEELLEKRKQEVPEGLKLSLLRMSKSMGNIDQYEHYQQKYASSDEKMIVDDKQIFVLYFDGVVSNKIEKSVAVPSHDHEQIIRISMPSYPAIKYQTHPLRLSTEKQNEATQAIEDINELARDDLDKDYPSILLLTTSRAVAKYQLVKKANEQDSFIGVLANIAAFATEIADVRSWNMLPATWQFGYINTDNERIMLDEQVVDISKAQQHLLLKTSLTNDVFHYQQ